jgi:CheY-like chemotaxis protein
MNRPLEILLAEDNHADARWFQLVLAEMNAPHRLSTVTDGERAMNFLLKRGEYSSAPDPDIVFMDFNLPRYTGPEVLEKVEGGRHIPVCVTTGSPMERDAILTKFRLNVPCYIVKPVDRQKIIDAFSCFDHLKPLAEALACES